MPRNQRARVHNSGRKHSNIFVKPYHNSSSFVDDDSSSERDSIKSDLGLETTNGGDSGGITFNIDFDEDEVDAGFESGSGVESSGGWSETSGNSSRSSSASLNNINDVRGLDDKLFCGTDGLDIVTDDILADDQEENFHSSGDALSLTKDTTMLSPKSSSHPTNIVAFGRNDLTSDNVFSLSPINMDGSDDGDTRYESRYDGSLSGLMGFGDGVDGRANSNRDSDLDSNVSYFSSESKRSRQPNPLLRPSVDRPPTPPSPQKLKIRVHGLLSDESFHTFEDEPISSRGTGSPVSGGLDSRDPKQSTTKSKGRKTDSKCPRVIKSKKIRSGQIGEKSKQNTDSKLSETNNHRENIPKQNDFEDMPRASEPMIATTSISLEPLGRLAKPKSTVPTTSFNDVTSDDILFESSPEVANDLERQDDKELHALASVFITQSSDFSTNIESESVKGYDSIGDRYDDMLPVAHSIPASCQKTDVVLENNLYKNNDFHKSIPEKTYSARAPSIEKVHTSIDVSSDTNDDTTPASEPECDLSHNVMNGTMGGDFASHEEQQYATKSSYDLSSPHECDESDERIKQEARISDENDDFEATDEFHDEPPQQHRTIPYGHEDNIINTSGEEQRHDDYTIGTYKKRRRNHRCIIFLVVSSLCTLLALSAVIGGIVALVLFGNEDFLNIAHISNPSESSKPSTEPVAIPLVTSAPTPSMISFSPTFAPTLAPTLASTTASPSTQAPDTNAPTMIQASTIEATTTITSLPIAIPTETDVPVVTISLPTQ